MDPGSRPGPLHVGDIGPRGACRKGLQLLRGPADGPAVRAGSGSPRLRHPCALPASPGKRCPPARSPRTRRSRVFRLYGGSRRAQAWLAEVMRLGGRDHGGSTVARDRDRRECRAGSSGGRDGSGDAQAWQQRPARGRHRRRSRPAGGDAAAGAWKILKSPRPLAPNGMITAISCRAANACEAVGDSFNGAGAYVTLEAWNGTAWKLQPSPDPADAADSSVLSGSRIPRPMPAKPTAAIPSASAS